MERKNRPGNPKGNLFAPLPEELPEELFEVLARGRGEVRVERILSRGHSSPDGFWYDQAEEEWVVLLRGGAVLEWEESGERWEMKPGDWVRIPAHCRHRVDQTDAENTTVWLAVHFASGTSVGSGG